MPYQSWFIAFDGSAQSSALAHLGQIHGARPGSLRLSIEFSPGRQFAAVAAPQGWIENPRFWFYLLGPRPPEAALRRALEACRSVEAIHRACTAPESFDRSIIAVDREAGQIHALTDRLNLSPIFHRHTGNQHIFASEVSLFPTASLAPDAGSVACFILNGSCLAGRTLYSEIAALPRASVHACEGGPLRSSVYWRYEPGRATDRGGFRARAAEDELWRLLVRSVDRTTRDRRVLLALSGGYDSAVLLGLLGAELKHPAVTCFSYAYGEPKPDSDAAVAARQAALYGYRHVTLPSYRDDFLAMLDRNAEIGEGLRAPAYEIEAYPALAEAFPNRNEQVVLFGDECFGWGSYRLQSGDDLLGAINLRSPALLAKLGESLGQAAAEALRRGLDAGYEQLRQATEPFARPDDAKDFLYLEQRIQSFLLPLRRRIAGHWFPVALPFLAPEVLDFMAGVPAPWRLDKRLFRAMARGRLPELFRIPRATRSQLHPDFDKEIRRAGEDLATRIAEQGWQIETLLPPATLAALVREFAARPRGSANGQTGAKQRLKKSMKALLAGSRFLEDRQRYLRRLSFNDFSTSPGTAFMLMNLLCMTDFFATHRSAFEATPKPAAVIGAGADPMQARSMLECR